MLFEKESMYPMRGSHFENYVINDHDYQRVSLSYFVSDTPGCKQKLTESIRAKLMERDELYDVNGYASDTNFTPLSEGITFLFNPYEVGPYVAGDVEIFVEREMLGDCLRNLPKL